MVWLDLLGMFLVAVGAMFILRRLLPMQVKEAGTHVLFIDAVLFRHRYLTGTVLTLVGIGLIIIGEHTMARSTSLIEWNIVPLSLDIIGLIAVTFGLLFLLHPMMVIRLNTMVDLVLGEDSTLMRQPILWGLLILSVGMILLYW